MIKTKRMANKTTHFSGSSGMGKTTKWRHMIGQADSDDGVRKPRLIWKNRPIKWQSQEVKWERFHFYTSLKLENSAWSWFHFYTSLKQKQTMLEKLSMPPTWWLNSRYMPPKLQSIWKVDGVKVQVTRSKKDSTWILRDLIKHYKKKAHWWGSCLWRTFKVRHQCHIWWRPLKNRHCKCI